MVSQQKFPSTQSHSARTAAQAITDTFTSLDFETQRTTVAASLIPKKPFPSKLSEFSPISSLSAMRKLLGYVWLAAMGDTSKRDGKGVENRSVPGTAGPQEGLLTTYGTPSQPQHCNRKWYQSSCSRYSTNGAPIATLQSAWRGSPVTNASLSSGVSRRTWMLDGETGTSGGKWTISTSRALLN